MKPDTPLVIRLFGPMEVSVHGTQIATASARKAMWLLAILALRAGHEVDRKWLAGTLWPDSDDELALYNLRRCLTVLRDLLGAERERIHAPSPRTVALLTEGAFVDVLEFDRLAATSDDDDLRTAVSLYKGALLEDCVEEWAIAERDRRQRQYADALDRLAKSAFGKRNYAEAQDLLRRAIRIEPYRESLHASLMESLAAGGDFGAAVLAYRDLRALLRNDLNTEPAAFCTEVYQRIRAEAKRRASDAPPSVEPVRAKQDGRSALPKAGADLIARESQIRELHHLLSQSRLITLSGPGGIGKTRLAIGVAQHAVEDFDDGVYFVDLSSLPKGADVTPPVAQALGFRQTDATPLEESILSHARSLKALILLDNCEHVIDSTAPLVEQLLRHCPDVRAIATSRRSLNLSGERLWPVPPLPFPEPGALESEGSLSSSAAAYGSIRLFVERAESADPAFELQDSNAQTVCRICQRLDGIPLAIELAAARVRGMTVDQIDERLQRQFGTITGGAINRIPRHRSMSAAIEWSYGLLDASERALLVGLSVFSGGFTLDAAETICHTPGLLERDDVLDVLLRLVDHSLVLFEGHSDEARYRLLETIRAYALEKLEKLEEGEEGRRVRARHFAYYYELADNRGEPLTGPQEGALLAQLDREHDNLRAALANADCGMDRARLAGAIWLYWRYRGHLEEGGRWLEQALAECEGADPSSDLARALLGAGALSFARGLDRASEVRLTQALAMYHAVNDKEGEATALNILGNLAWQQEDYETGRARLEQAADLWRQLNDVHRLAIPLFNLAALALDAGDIDRAAELLDESLKHLRAVGMEQTAAGALMNLALIAVYREQYDRARNLAEQGLEIHRRFDHRPATALATYNLGLVAVYQRDLATARRMLSSAVAQWTALASAGGRQTALCGLMELLTAEGDLQKAARVLGASEVFLEQRNIRITPAMRPAYERSLQALRAGLPDAEFAEAVAAGRLLSLDQALDLALPP